jgi:fructose transport system substrate-binding protein
MRRSSGSVRLVAIAAIGAALFTAGCSAERTGGGGSAAGGSGPVKIGLVTKTDTNPYFVALREAAKAQAAQQNAQLIALAGKFDGDNEGQVAAIENLVQQGVKGIMITPSNSGGIIGALQQAKSRGILVIALDTETDPKDAVDATWATDNTDAGRKQGAYVKAALNGIAPKLLMVDGTSGAAVDTQRHNGFLEGIGLQNGAPQIAGAANANGDQNLAQQATENLLQRTTDVNSAYTINEPTARGVNVALAAKNLTTKVTVGSIDGGCQAMADLKAGKYAATVMQFPKKMAQEGVSAVVAFAQSGTKPTGFHDTGSQLVTDKPLGGLESKDTSWGQQNCWG